MDTFAIRPNSSRWQSLLIAAIVLFLALREGLPLVVGFAQEADPVGPRTPLGSAFTYQGQIENNGVPANGPFDMQVALFDSASGGNLIEVLPLLLGVNVVDGLFSVQVNFAETAFRGQERWLEVSLRTSGGGNFTTLPRQQLTATPYALYAKATDWNGVANVPQALTIGAANCTNGQIWKRVGGTWQCATDEIGGGGGGPHTHIGETWSGSVPHGLSITSLTGKGLLVAGLTAGIEATATANDATAISGSHTGTCIGIDFCYGVHGTSNNLGGMGVRGDGFIAGVFGEGFQNGVFGRGTGPGVQGESTASQGVFGKSTSGDGVYGQSTSGSGVFGTTSSGASDTAGVKGQNPMGVGVLGLGSIGLFGESTNTSLAGVFGKATNGDGVWGQTTSGSGVFGQSSSNLITQGGVRGSAPSGVGVLGEGVQGVRAVGSSDGLVATVTAAGTGNGVEAQGYGPGSQGAGIYGLHTSTVNCTAPGAGSPGSYCMGVWAEAAGGAGIGLYAKAPNTAVWADGGNYGVYADGTLYAGYFEGNVLYTGALSPSDARLKRDVAPLDYGLAAIEALQPKSYSYIEGDGAVRFGLLAQDVEQVLPELVTTNPQDGMLAMNYTDLIPVLIRAIQEQQEEIEGLRAQIGGPADGEPSEAAAANLTSGSTTAGTPAMAVALGAVLVAVASAGGTTIILRRKG